MLRLTWGDMASDDGARSPRGAAPVSSTVPQAASHWEADGASSGRAVATTVAIGEAPGPVGPSARARSPLNSIEAPDAAQYRGRPFREPRWW